MAQIMVDGVERGRVPCPECQGDGVPCMSVHVACEECQASRPAAAAVETPRLDCRRPHDEPVHKTRASK